MSEENSLTTSEMKILQDAILQKEIKKALKFLEENKGNTSFKANLIHYRCIQEEEEEKKKLIGTEETILHFAAVHLDEKYTRIIEKIVEIAPELLQSSKMGLHQGQTPLHIFIVRKQNDTLKNIKRLLSKWEIGDIVRHNIFNPQVTGTLFHKTIMEGELPFIVAALTLDIQTAKLVIDMTEEIFYAKINSKTSLRQKDVAQNSKRNTVYHCLVEHAARHPDDLQKVIAMWKFLTSFATDGKGDTFMQTALWPENVFHLTNRDNMRPLQLAASRGVPELFNMIMNEEKIPNLEDRLFDSYLFDISVIDTVSHFIIQREMKAASERKNAKRNRVDPSADPTSTKPTAENAGSQSKVEVGRAITNEKFRYSQSVLEMLCNSTVARNESAVFDIIRQPPMKKLIERKWDSRKYFLLFCMVCHVLTMSLYSVHAVQWSLVAFPSNSTYPETTDSQRSFVFVSSIVLIFVDVIYILITILLIIGRYKRPNSRAYLINDLEYILLLILFSFCLLVDRIWYHVSLEHGAVFLLFSLLSGWWFMIFFFRPFKLTSFYVAMIKKVIFGDMFRFALFIILSLISFTIAFQVLYQGEGIKTAYDGTDTSKPLKVFGQTLLLNFQLLFGFGDINLDEAREPAMAYIVYITYVIMTYLVLLNSLIAMMSETCASVKGNDKVFYHTQRLKVILFLEEIIYPFWYIDPFIPKTLFELRRVKRDGNTVKSFFLKMTDENQNNESEEKVSSTVNQHNLINKNTDPLTIKITQPFYEEILDGNTNTVKSTLRWNDGDQTDF